MLRLFLRYVIGGQTGKRESAWFAFLFWGAWTAWMIYVEYVHDRGLEMSQSMWMVVTPFVFTWLGTAHGFEWVSRQTRWGSTPLSLRDAASITTGDPVPDAIMDTFPGNVRGGPVQYADMHPGTDTPRVG